MKQRINPLIRAARRGLPVAFGLCMMVSATAYAAPYTVTDLGALGLSGDLSFGYGINASGQVTGNSAVTSGAWIGLRPHAFLYSNGAMTDLGTLGGGGASSFGHGINDAGSVTGYSETTSGTRAFVYSNGTMTALGTLGGSTSVGYAINNSGQVTGYSTYTGDTPGQAFLYSNGSMIGLGALGGVHSIGYDINDAGQVTGLGYTSGNVTYHAFIHSNGSMVDLGTLEGHNYSEGRAINASGQVAGTSSVTSGGNSSRAFLYSDGTMINLGTMGGIASFGYGINGAGQVVGSVLVGTDYRDRAIHNAFLYSDGNMVDLNSLIDPLSDWTLSVASDINDAGQIVGWGISPNGGEFHAFLLTPVPEPETYAMLLAGLAVIGVAVRRRG